MNTQYYFAYGSNLNAADWQSYCDRKGLRKGLLKFHSIAYLPDHDIVFSRHSDTREGGVLDITPRLGQIVPGVLFEVDDEGWKALDRKEGVSKGCYEPMTCFPIDDRGAAVLAKTYRVVRDCNRKDYVRPGPKYVNIVRTGLEAFQLPTEAMLAAAEGRIPPYLITSFFFYGTLLRGEPRFDMLRPFGMECILLARAFGRLVDLGSYPGMVDLATSEHTVEGEFVRVSDLAGAIAVLDSVEGFGGHGTSGSLYHRTLIGVDIGEGRIRQAWAYRYARDTGHAVNIASGDWRIHKGCRDRFLSALVADHVAGDDRRVAAEIAEGIPFSFGEDRGATVEALLPLHAALARGDISERILAQRSGKWAVIPPQ